jgi:DNA-directed RNA polymerase subunit RPC12/RpoP
MAGLDDDERRMKRREMQPIEHPGEGPEIIDARPRVAGPGHPHRDRAPPDELGEPDRPAVSRMWRPLAGGERSTEDHEQRTCPAPRRVSWNDPAARGDSRSHWALSHWGLSHRALLQWALSHWAPGGDLPADRELRAVGFARVRPGFAAGTTRPHRGDQACYRHQRRGRQRQPTVLHRLRCHGQVPQGGLKTPPEPGYAGTPAPQTGAPTGLGIPPPDAGCPRETAAPRAAHIPVRVCQVTHLGTHRTGKATCKDRKWPLTWSGWPDLNRRPLRPELAAALGVRSRSPASSGARGRRGERLCGPVAVLSVLYGHPADLRRKPSCLGGKPTRTAGPFAARGTAAARQRRPETTRYESNEACPCCPWTGCSLPATPAVGLASHHHPRSSAGPVPLSRRSVPGVGYLCPVCGEAIPAETPCPCDVADAPEDLLFERKWPKSLDEAMRCQRCGAKVNWRQAQGEGQALICPECHGRRWTKNAGKKVRRRVGERDGWVCHRCGVAIDQSLSWPHPLSPVADHHPISRNQGGPTILANLKIAHSLCNGSSYLFVRAPQADDQGDGAQGPLMAVIPDHRLSADAEIGPGESTVAITA